MFERFSDKAIKVIMLAQEEARNLKQNFVGTEHLLLGLIGENSSLSSQVLQDMGANLSDARREVEQTTGRGSGFVPAEIPFTPLVKRILERALEESSKLGHNYIGSEHIFLSLCQDEDSVAAKVLNKLGINMEDARKRLMDRLGDEEIAVPAGGRGNNNNNAKTATLDEFGTNLTASAAEGNLDPVVGRDSEIERMVQILCRRTKNNPVLVGEPGVGKTAIAEGLAQRIANKDIPELLEGKQVYNLDMGSLVSGTRYRGEFEERLKNIIEEVKNAGNIILVIDEIHTIIGAGAIEGAMDAANLLKPALARGELQCIGATTLDEYRKHIERDAALERRFQPIMVGEPSIEDTIEILIGLRSTYEEHHKLTISDEALVAATKLSDRYISDRYLPDKAIDLVDEAGSRVRLSNATSSPQVRELKKQLADIVQKKESAVAEQDFETAKQLREQEIEINQQLEQARQEEGETPQNNPVVQEEDIAQIVASWTGIPVMKLTESESDRLLHLEDTLHERLIGQEEAVKAVSRSLRRARVGLKNPNRPIASFIFSGPTGVGKTELTKALADQMFGSEESMVRLDMSEFMERHTVSKLIGSPPGFVGYEEGGQLTEAVRSNPYTVILMDEIEKAHPDVFNMLLQILEDGRLTDAKGRTVSFKNTLLIMTSNIGSKAIEKGGGGMGFELVEDEGAAAYDRIKGRVNDEMKGYFRPEFLNRIDDVIVFRQLNKDEIKHIADILLQEISQRLYEEQEIHLEVTDALKDHLVEKGYDPTYGARPLRRTIMQLLEDNLAEAILSSQLEAGTTAVVDVDSEGNIRVADKANAQHLPAFAGASN
ncbi:ATP-dependent Clp protease ATP-binding subunit [Geitlerinema sp. PCC 9228]|jgi:ATP-dependent Clp protease ATP-binding subunit ClpC|uniref:ATP-dependent Clp protease ATP-binding subunit n=1 Tax=Geitlerinema sp. PCC 9228 TaxID=111611 RepID=UPI0008F99326|nr:ATP-dependent Clp protease ATP-binding subunit [Geitlerinema sp. PCC 9228]